MHLKKALEVDDNFSVEKIPSLSADIIVAAASDYRAEAADEAAVEDFEGDAKPLLPMLVPGVDRDEEVAAEAEQEGDDETSQQRRQKILCCPSVHFTQRQQPSITSPHTSIFPPAGQLSVAVRGGGRDRQAVHQQHRHCSSELIS